MANKISLLGRVGQSPEIKYLDSGTAITKFSLATSDKYKDKSGKLQEDTQWHNIVVWSKQAEVIKEHVKKGDQLYIEGKVQYRTYEKDGEKKYFTEIKMQSFEFVGGGVGSAPTSEKEPQSAEPNQDDDDLPEW